MRSNNSVPSDHKAPEPPPVENIVIYTLWMATGMKAADLDIIETWTYQRICEVSDIVRWHGVINNPDRNKKSNGIPIDNPRVAKLMAYRNKVMGR